LLQRASALKENLSGKHDYDRDNMMPLEEALALDKAAAALFPQEFLPMVPVLYPQELDNADKGIASKLEGLERDTPILLPTGITIPYWQTLQYANRNFRLFVTRFREPKANEDVITEDERIRVWAMTAIAHKRMLTDVFKECVMARDDIPSRGTTPRSAGDLSAAIFHKKLEHVYRGSSFSGQPKKGGGGKKIASAWATGKGIKFNTVTKILDKKLGSFVGLYLHEQSHNMGYGHQDKIPWVIQKCAGSNKKKKGPAYFTAYDLAESPDFTVAS